MKPRSGAFSSNTRGTGNKSGQLFTASSFFVLRFAEHHGRDALSNVLLRCSVVVVGSPLLTREALEPGSYGGNVRHSGRRLGQFNVPVLHLRRVVSELHLVTLIRGRRKRLQLHPPDDCEETAQLSSCGNGEVQHLYHLVDNRRGRVCRAIQGAIARPSGGGSGR